MWGTIGNCNIFTAVFKLTREETLEPGDRAPIFPMDYDSLMMKSFPKKNRHKGLHSNPDGGIKVFFFFVGRSPCHLSRSHCPSIVKVNGILPVI